MHSPSVKVADEVWIATALLHREQPERRSFSVGEIRARAAREALHMPLRPGVQVHASQHCVANKPPNPGAYRMLYATPDGGRRLFRKGDFAHPSRGGKVTPSAEELPLAYQSLIDWYHNVYDLETETMEQAGLPSLFELELNVQTQTEQGLPDAQNLLTRLLNAYLERFRQLGSYRLRSDRDEQVLMLALVTRSFNSARCGYDLARRGYYQQAIALARMIDEDWLTAWDVAFTPKAREALWNHQRARPFKEIAKDITRDDGSWWDDLYGPTSEIVHPRGRSLAMQYQRDQVRLGPIFDNDFAVASFAALIGAATRMLAVLDGVLRKAQVAVDDSHQQLRHEIEGWQSRMSRDSKFVDGISIYPENSTG